MKPQRDITESALFASDCDRWSKRSLAGHLRGKKVDVLRCPCKLGLHLHSRVILNRRGSDAFIDAHNGSLVSAGSFRTAPFFGRPDSGRSPSLARRRIDDLSGYLTQAQEQLPLVNGGAVGERVLRIEPRPYDEVLRSLLREAA